MIVTFYENESTRNTAVKQIVKKFDMPNVVLKDNCTMLDPVLKIRLNSNELSHLYRVLNYFYIDIFDRYYFINSINFENGYVEISGHVDVLTTYYNKGLKDLSCVTRRQENRYNTFLNDNDFLCYNQSIITQKAFPNGFSSGYSPVLIVSGGD